MDLISIPSLTPFSTPPSSKALRAVVTLSWPYSSSTRQLALLFADPDFRLRNHKGQVRVRFTGPSAAAVAKARIGIGDEVVLGLDGALWEEDSEAGRTPGRSVDGALVFERRVRLKVVRGGREDVVDVDAPLSPTRSPERSSVVQTPINKTLRGLREERATMPAYTYTSPAFVKRVRLSGDEFSGSRFDPFVDDDDELEEAERPVFGSQMNWRYAEAPSPTKEKGEAPRALDEDVPWTAENVVQQPSASMLPPPLPSLQMPKERLDTMDLDNERPSTPKLQPVGSPTLPMPSPFPADSRMQSGILDAPSSTLSRTPEQSIPIQSELDVTNSTDLDKSQDVDGVDEIVYTKADLPVGDDFEIVEVSSDIGQEDDVSPSLPPALEGGLVDMTASVAEEKARAQQQDQSAFSQPETPARIRNQPPATTFGLDGATPTTSSPQVTPQSEKEREMERIMARTYSSLFGFKKAPEMMSSGPSIEPVDVEAQSPTPATTLFRPKAETLAVVEGDVEETPEVAVNLTENLTASSVPEIVVAEGVPEITTHESVTTVDSEVGESPTITPEENRAPTAEHFEEVVRNEAIPEEPIGTLPQVLPSSTPQSTTQVIDLDQSSNEEAEEPSFQPLPASRPQEHRPRLEVQDTYEDSEAENLMGVETETLRRTTMVDEAAHSVKPANREQDEEAFDLIRPEAFANSDADEPMVDAADFRDSLSINDQGKASLIIETDIDALARSKDKEVIPVSSSKSEPSQLQLREETEQAPLQQTQRPLYPSLPMSPSYSQERFSQTFDESGLPESVLPPTPQLTQAESSLHVLPEGETSVLSEHPDSEISTRPVESAEQEAEITPKPLRRSSRRRQNSLGSAQSDLLASSSQQDTAQDVEVTPKQQRVTRQTRRTSIVSAQSDAQTSNQPRQAESPPKPQRVTRQTRRASVSSAQSDIQASSQSQNTAKQVDTMTSPQRVTRQTRRNSVTSAVSDLQPSNQPLETIEESESLSKPQRKTPARRSQGSRLSSVPDVISEWFSPRPTSEITNGEQAAESRPATRLEQPEMVEIKGNAGGLANGHALAERANSPTRRAPAKGLSTSLSYFTPLSTLDKLLNSSSQQSFGNNTVDVFAIVTDSTKEPARAKSGPRDFFTIFRISDTSLQVQSSIRVETFRPWKATLPVAGVGDVILLRAFAVKTRKRQPYLLSTNSSAWCVWRGESGGSTRSDDGRPIWATRRSSSSGTGVREETNGPPVELGDEERAHAERLREWWISLHSDDEQEADVDEELDEGGMNGHVTQPLAAKM